MRNEKSTNDHTVICVVQRFYTGEMSCFSLADHRLNLSLSLQQSTFEEVLFKKVHVHLKWFLAICKKTSKEILRLHNLILMVISNSKQGKNHVFIGGSKIFSIYLELF